LMSFETRIRPVSAFAAAPRTPRTLLCLTIAAAAILIALRLPGAWAEGRFQDEEASVFLAYAWHFPAFEALMRPFGGYWNVAANGLTLLVLQAIRADWVSLAEAPYLTMTAGLLAQLIPVLLILTGRASWLPSLRVRLLALLLILFLPETEEVYLNVIHIQLHLALSVALILSLDVPERRRERACYHLILLLAPLCGPAAVIFLPLLLLRAAVERSPGRTVQATILGLGAAIQLLFFYAPVPIRGVTLDLVNVAAAFFIRMITLPLLGDGISERLALLAESALFGGRGLLYAMAAASVLLFGTLMLRLVVLRNAAAWLLAASLLVAGVSFGLGMASGNPVAPFFVNAGQRYNYIPLALLALALLGAAIHSEGAERRLLGALLATMLVIGLIDYNRPMEVLARGPSWAAEVEAWNKNPYRRLATWPTPYRADLSPKAYDCGPPGAQWGDSAAPRYCESGWMHQSFGLPEAPRGQQSRR
jgi:hypothetical protein